MYTHVYICTCTERRHAPINPNATLSTPTSVHAERVETCACNSIAYYRRASGLLIVEHVSEHNQYASTMWSKSPRSSDTEEKPDRCQYADVTKQRHIPRGMRSGFERTRDVQSYCMKTVLKVMTNDILFQTARIFNDKATECSKSVMMGRE